MKNSSLVTRCSSLSKRTEPRSGTVLMEAVLCLPLILLLVTGIVQFSRIWEAKLFTHYAAYNAARAALVYNPADYANVSVPGRMAFREHRGPVWQAAVNTLAWKSASENSGNNLLFPGFRGRDAVPDSARIWTEVTVDPNASWESNGLVCVTVRFDFPLLFSIFDPSILTPSSRGEGEEDPLSALDAGPERNRSFRIEESCILPKPWSTAHYPRLSLEEGQTLADFHSWGVPSDAPPLPQ